jgi:dihydropteroate synthase
MVINRMNASDLASWLKSPQRRPLVMGVLNVTPDSFSDGGRFFGVEAAVEQARKMVEAGADLIDIGGESTKPGAAPVAAQEQIGRIIPVLKGVAGRLPVLFSVDTTKAAVARAALEHGAQIINDISAGRDDPEMLPLAASAGVPVVLMHMQGQPATMQVRPHYDDVVSEVSQFLRDRAAAAEAAGVAAGRILLDPGIGFGKTAEHNLTLLRDLGQFPQLGKPLVLGVSRKAFIGRITGESEPSQRVFGTAASVAWCVANGAAIVRVHDVEPMVKVVRTIQAIRNGGIV